MVVTKTIFVTGATGFIGSHFLKTSLKAGHSIVALRASPRSHSRVPLRDEQQFITSRRLQWVCETMSAVSVHHLAECDTFVHLAAAGVNTSNCGWLTPFSVNVLDSLSIWLRAIQAGIKSFVVCGSCFEYGSSGELYEFIPVSAPLRPKTAYAASKASATMAALALAKEYHLSLTVARPFHVYGDGEDPLRFWPTLCKAAAEGKNLPMTHGQQVRDFTPVEYVAEQLLRLCVDISDPGHPQIHNIGLGQAQSLRAFAEYWWKTLNATGKLMPGALPYRPLEVMRYVPEI